MKSIARNSAVFAISVATFLIIKDAKEEKIMGMPKRFLKGVAVAGMAVAALGFVLEAIKPKN